jgi:LPXTG-motif cell wall-anchored protein
VLVETPAGKRLKHSSFALDTFVPKTGIAFPVFVHGKALPTGSYRAKVTVHYAGETTSRWFYFTISAKDLAQVFGAQPQTRPGTGGKSSLWLLIGAGVLLLLLGFLAATVWARRQRRRLEARMRERERKELELWTPRAPTPGEDHAPVAGDELLDDSDG